MLKKYKVMLIVSGFIIATLFLIVRNSTMTQSLSNVDKKYIMYSLVSDSTYAGMNNREPFDASYLLKQPRYIRASDSRLIDLEYQPMNELDRMLLFDIQEKIPDSPPFTAFKHLHFLQFENEIKDKIRWEYLYSGFSTNSSRKKPDYDDFKFYITVDGQEYILIVSRSKCDDRYHIFDRNAEIKDALTYSKYLLQQSKNNDFTRS